MMLAPRLAHAHSETEPIRLPILTPHRLDDVRLWRVPLSTSAFFTHSRTVCAVQPILAETETIVAHPDGCSRCTSRAARERTSGENLLPVCLLMAPSWSLRQTRSGSHYVGRMLVSRFDPALRDRRKARHR